MQTVDFSENIAASDLKVCRCRQLIGFMKVCKYVNISLYSLAYSKNVPLNN